MNIGKHILLLDGTSLPDRGIIGGKAWSIAKMGALGLRVPPAFVITTPVCSYILEHGAPPEGLADAIAQSIGWLEQSTSRQFGIGSKPLLVSVRSGAPISMPGMMDAILNLGMNEATEAALASECGDPAFARDTHRRFLELYSNIVLNSPIDLDKQEEPDQWREKIRTVSGQDVPQDVRAQLQGGIDAVFRSWNSRRARRYREHHGISHSLGTAVTVQAMVFGNLDDRSGTGVLFSRNPLTGDPAPYGEFLKRAQGEDIVSGRQTPMPLSDLAAYLPKIHEELLVAAKQLETDSGDVQDIEFTLERGTLYLLQTRVAKRAPQAAVRIAYDMVQEGTLSPADALKRISSNQIRTLLSPRLAAGAEKDAAIIATGEAASPGIGVGMVVTSSDEAEKRAEAGEDVILARITTSPDDLHGMIAAKAIITEHGGSTSHAAVVGRALGRPCVVGCGADALVGLAGQIVTVDGGSGTIFAGALDVQYPDAQSDNFLAVISGWAKQNTSVTILETPEYTGVDAIDFDAYTEDFDQALAKVSPASTVRGAIFANNDDILHQAISAGATTIVTSPPLPALVASAQLNEQNNRKEIG